MANYLPKVGRLGRRPKNPTKGSRRGEGSPQVGVAVAARGAAAGRGAGRWAGSSLVWQVSQLTAQPTQSTRKRQAIGQAIEPAGRRAFCMALAPMAVASNSVACQVSGFPGNSPGSGFPGHFALAGWFLGSQADKTPSCNLPPPHQIPARLPKPPLPARPAASCR